MKPTSNARLAWRVRPPCWFQHSNRIAPRISANVTSCPEGQLGGDRRGGLSPTAIQQANLWYATFGQDDFGGVRGCTSTSRPLHPRGLFPSNGLRESEGWAEQALTPLSPLRLVRPARHSPPAWKNRGPEGGAALPYFRSAALGGIFGRNADTQIRSALLARAFGAQTIRSLSEGSPIPGPQWGPSDRRNRGGCPDLIGTGEGLLPPPASRLRGAVRRPRDPSTDGLTDHSAVPSITSAHKLINMEDEIPRSHYARSGITPCLLAR